MRFDLARTLVVGVALCGFAAVGPAHPVAQVQAQEATSGTRDAPSLTEDEFDRLYERMTGVWVRQPDKSTSTRGAPADLLIVTYAADGERAIKYTNRRIVPGGQETITSSRQVLDGQDYPTTSGDLSIARMPLDEFTIETTARRDGTLTGRNTQFFSADGHRMSVIARSVDADGERLTGISVFDKLQQIDE